MMFQLELLGFTWRPRLLPAYKAFTPSHCQKRGKECFLGGLLSGSSKKFTLYHHKMASLNPGAATVTRGQELKRKKIGTASFFSTLTNLWAHACGRGRIVLSFECVMSGAAWVSSLNKCLALHASEEAHVSLRPSWSVVVTWPRRVFWQGGNCIQLN